MSASTELKNMPSGASDMAHIVLTFDDNKLASALYGPFDENLAQIEQRLGVDIRSKGNQLTVKGESVAACIHREYSSGDGVPMKPPTSHPTKATPESPSPRLVLMESARSS